jgi:hypothetical protein
MPPPAELEFIDLRDRPGDELLTAIHAAGGLYERSFPRDEEREDLETHRDALWGAGRETPPLLHFIVATPPGRPDEIVGFAAAEYYPASSCGLLSYIAVDQSRRNSRVGHSLVQRSVDILRADAGAAGHRLAAVFGEIHDPGKVEPGDDSMAPLDRLRVMDALGARRVPVPYVQPPLSAGGERGRALMLVAFPVEGHPVASLETSIVRGFLAELYEVLEVPQLQLDLDFARSLVALQDDTLDLMRLVPREHPTFVDGTDGPAAMHDYGIAIHLVLEPGTGRAPSRPESDPLLSFEEDILAYADPYPSTDGIGTAPFCTSAVEVPEEWAFVSVSFPAEVTFRSEGRLVPLRCAGLDDEPGLRAHERRRTRRFLLRASRTDFARSGLTVLHLVLGPDPGAAAASALNEYDLIKLMKLWQPGEGLTRDGGDATPGRQRKFVTFKAGGSTETPVDDSLTADEALERLARAVFGLDESQRVDIAGPRAGTMQMLHAACEQTGDARTPNICGEVDEVLSGEGAADPSSRLRALGGVVCGLLDFLEIDGDELADVFRQVDREDELVRSFHKGTLIVASAGDRAFDSEGVRLSVGLNPYLLIPHGVLLHNEWWLSHAVRQLDEASHGRRRTSKLEQARADVTKTLSQRLVANVFNYQDERSLYETGLSARGLDKRERAVRDRLADLTGKLHARHELNRSYIGTAVAVILLVFTLSDVYDKHSHTYVLVGGAVTLGLLALLLLAFWRDDDHPRRDRRTPPTARS